MKSFKKRISFSIYQFLHFTINLTQIFIAFQKNFHHGETLITFLVTEDIIIVMSLKTGISFTHECRARTSHRVTNPVTHTHTNNYEAKFWPFRWHRRQSNTMEEEIWSILCSMSNTDLLRQKHVGRVMMTGSVEKTTHIHKKILCLFIFIPSQSIIFIEGQIFEIPLVLVLVPVTVYLIFPQLLIGVQWIWHFTLCWRRLGSFLQAPKVWFWDRIRKWQEWVEGKTAWFAFGKKKKKCVTKQFNVGKKDCDESVFFFFLFSIWYHKWV